MQSATASPGFVAAAQAELERIDREVGEHTEALERLIELRGPLAAFLGGELVDRATSGAEAPASTRAGGQGKPPADPPSGRKRAPARRRTTKKKAVAPAGPVSVAALTESALRESGDWMAPREIGEKIGKRRDLVSQACGELVAAGTIEHNGRATKASRFRIGGAASAEKILPPLGKSPAMSARTRKSIERAEQEAAAQNGKPKDDGLEARIREALEEQSSTIRELSENLDIELPEVAPVVAAMREAGELIACGKRMPRRDQVYGLAGAE